MKGRDLERRALLNADMARKRSSFAGSNLLEC